MKVSTEQATATVRRQFTIHSGHPVVGMAYANPPKKVRIERGVIEYSWKDGAWTVKDAWAIDISGPVLKKDGTDSKNDHTRHPGEDRPATSRTGFSRYIPDAEYAWLTPIIDLLRPTPEMGMMILNEAEVGA